MNEPAGEEGVSGGWYDEDCSDPHPFTTLVYQFVEKLQFLSVESAPLLIRLWELNAKILHLAQPKVLHFIGVDSNSSWNGYWKFSAKQQEDPELLLNVAPNLV